MLNEKHFTGHWWIISILLLLLLIDGSLASVLAQWIMRPSFMGTPQLTLLGLVMVTLLVPEEKYTTWIAALIGLIFDSFYTGILGVNALLFALVIYIVRQIRPCIPHTAVFVWCRQLFCESFYWLWQFQCSDADCQSFGAGVDGQSDSFRHCVWSIASGID